jgi:hypothetical protein
MFTRRSFQAIASNNVVCSNRRQRRIPRIRGFTGHNNSCGLQRSRDASQDRQPFCAATNGRQNTSKHRDLSGVTDGLRVVGIYRVEQVVKSGDTEG